MELLGQWTAGRYVEGPMRLLREIKAFWCPQGMDTWVTTVDKSLYETVTQT